MPTILCIETATAVCSVSLSRDGVVLGKMESDAGFDHAEKLTCFIESLFKQSDLTLNEIDAVAVSGGPGSYTGLRIGISTAKGVCFALDKPMIAIPTLLSMAAGASCMIPGIPAKPDVMLCPMLDARRMEVYTALFTTDLNEVVPVSAMIVEASFFNSFLEHNLIYFFGDGMAKCKSLIGQHPNARFIDDYSISATHLLEPALAAFSEHNFVHTALYEPFYFKEFVAGKGSVAPESKR